MDELLLALLLWIGAASNATELEYNGQPLPTVGYGTHKELVRMARGKDADPKNYDLQAVYDHKTNKIWLRVGLDTTKERTRAVLVHELVHYLQDVNGTLEKRPCMAANELLAYDLDGEYRRSHGVRIPWNEITVLARSQCGSPM